MHIAAEVGGLSTRYEVEAERFCIGKLCVQTAQIERFLNTICCNYAVAMEQVLSTPWTLTGRRGRVSLTPPTRTTTPHFPPSPLCLLPPPPLLSSPSPPPTPPPFHAEPLKCTLFLDRI